MRTYREFKGGDTVNKKGKHSRFKKFKKTLIGLTIVTPLTVLSLFRPLKGYIEQNKTVKEFFSTTDDELQDVVIIAEDIPEEFRRHNNEEDILNQEVEDYTEEEVETLRTSTELSDMGYEFGNPNCEKNKEINEDYTAWLQIDGTDINHRVVQGTDNEYYSDHNFAGEESKRGTLFIDYRNNDFEYEMEELSDVTFIYGHNMRGDGTMFAPIVNYKSQAYFDKYPYAVLYGENGDIYKIDFFAGNIVDIETEYIYTPDFISEIEYDAYIQNLIDNSTFESPVEIHYGDKIIGLVTCGGNYAGGSERFILYGVMTLQKELEVESNEKTLGLR